MPEAFHFLRPEWFYLLIPMAGVLLFLVKPTAGAKDPWIKVIDKDLLPWLREKSAGTSSRNLVWLLTAGWIIAVVALANPVWEKLPQPVFQTDQARVIVLDLSLSMNSTDLKPARIDRARFKISDILAQQQEGVIGLVVFAGDAFVVSPLTRDGETIAAQLQALKPDIMPVQGSRADLGLLKAGDLLKQAGRLKGEILLLADSYTDDRTLKAASELRKQGVITSVLGVGTEEGAPLPSGRGEFVRNDDGDVITTRLDISAMQKLASAGGGDYVSLSSSDSDISRLMQARVESTRSHSGDEFNQTTRWKETGPWLVLLLLPLAALAFRRGWLASIVLLAITGLPTEPAMAFSMTDLWLRQDQQAHKALVEGDLDNAAKLAQDPLRKGVAEYKQGDFEQAEKDFSLAQGAEAAYNRGNALAKLGSYREAIDAYEQALEQQADMEDAQYNKQAVEKLLQQQQDQNNEQGKQQGNNSQQQGQEKHDKNEGDQQSAENNQGQEQQDQSGQGAQEQNNGQDQSEANGNKQGQSTSASEPENSDEKDKQNHAGSGEKNAFAEAAKHAAEQTGDEPDMAQNEIEAGAEEKADQKQANESNAQSMAQEQQDITEEKDNPSSMEASAEELSSEEQIAAEQWLRRIPDDPAGLLRRKLRYQYIQRGGQSGNPSDAQPW